jgi:CheY-like chemotaxis protein
VIQNLVLNATQAMPGGGTVHVTVEPAQVGPSHPVMPPGAYVKVTVRDTGMGIAPEILPRIFDPFFTTKPGGSGLGLAICYSIVKKHNGFLEASSKPGKGAEFVLFLPAVPSIQDDEHASKRDRPHQGCGSALVMDDAEFLRDVASAMLRRMGYEVTTAKDGSEALQRMTEKTYQLVLLDLTIPGGMGGVEAVREIRKRYGTTPVAIAMSGYSEAQVISNPQDAGFDAGIAKPFTMTDLANLLNKVARHRAAKSQS